MKIVIINKEKYLVLGESNFEKSTEEDIFKRIIPDVCNVMGIVPIKRDFEITDEFNLPELKLAGYNLSTYWKKVESELISPRGTGLFNFESYNISNTIYSKEFINKAKEISGIFGYGKEPEVFLMWDKEKNLYIEENPVLLVFGRKLMFLLAPRVEDGEKK
jgi:hypothetical protein